MSRLRSLLLALGLSACSGPAPDVLDDVSRLNETRVAEVVHVTRDQDAVAAVRRARASGRKVAIAGRRHSQGGQAFAEDAAVLDMTGYRRVLGVDEARREVTVESGASWDDVQRALAPRGLAVRVMQSSNIFTIGGSISANVHGRDLDTGCLVETIVRMRVLLPSGEVKEVAPATEPELFSLVVGGYGLVGVILDVTLGVTDDRVLEHRAALVRAEDVPAWLREARRPGQLFIARPSIAPSSFLDETLVEVWTPADVPRTPDLARLGEETHVARDRAVFSASRASDTGKEVRWKLQKAQALSADAPRYLTRNNAMRPPTTPLRFLEHTSESDTDIVQEYFIPDGSYGCFLASARRVIRARHVNLLGLTIRHVAGSRTAFLSYAPEDSFAFMLYTNQSRDAAGRAAAQAMTRELVDASLACGGRHYLTYQNWPTGEQVRAAYPGIDEFFARKRGLDPGELFQSKFYLAYRPAAR